MFGQKKEFCVKCHAVGVPRNHTPGNLLIEILLWCCLIVPGLIYSAWRMGYRKKVCRTCGGGELIPVGSPRAAQIVAESRGRVEN